MRDEGDSEIYLSAGRYDDEKKVSNPESVGNVGVTEK